MSGTSQNLPLVVLDPAILDLVVLDLVVLDPAILDLVILDPVILDPRAEPRQVRGDDRRRDLHHRPGPARGVSRTRFYRL